MNEAFVCIIISSKNHLIENFIVLFFPKLTEF